MKIVRVEEGDLAKLHALLHWRRTGERLPGSADYSQQEAFPAIGQLLREGHLWVYAAEVDGAYVGYVSVAKVPKPDARLAYLYVDELWVADPYRQRGIATLLMRAVEDLARKLAVWRIRLVTSPALGPGPAAIPEARLLGRPGFVL